MSDIDYISYIIFGLVVWAFLSFMGKHDRARRKFEFSVKWLFTFLLLADNFSFFVRLLSAKQHYGGWYFVHCRLCSLHPCICSCQ